MAHAHPRPDPTATADGAGVPAAATLVLTGERTLPGIADENYWFQRHVAAYALAADLRQRHGARVVLDAGCGEGYGLALLAAVGTQRVIGVDLDETVIAHAAATYAATSPVVEVHAAELMALPLADDEVDLTVSLQVIEHLHDIPGYLRSLHRVTRPNGLVVIATPNRLTFTPGSDVPVNPFHTREFTAAELHDELEAAGFEVDALLGVHHGPRLAGLEAAAGRPFPDLVTATPPDAWPGWLRRTVHAAEPGWFAVHGDDLDTSLDLIAVCRVPG